MPTTLLMPCLPCVPVPACTWPPNPTNGLVAQISGIANGFLCSECNVANGLHFQFFDSIDPGPPVVCRWSIPRPPFCTGFNKLETVVSEQIDGSALVVTSISDGALNVLATWQVAIPVPQLGNNGPFLMNLTAAQILQCNFAAQVCEISGIG